MNKSEKNTNGIFYLLPLLIVGVALLLRLTALGAKSIYVDEGVTVFICQRPIGAIVPLMMEISEVHPPLYFWFINIWINLWKTFRIIIPDYLVWLRLSSVICGVLSVWLTYILSLRLIGKKAALWAAAFLGVSSFHLYYSQELRMYPVLLCLFLGSFILYLKMLEKPSFLLGAGVATVTGAALLTHYYGFYIIFIEFLWSLFLFLSTRKAPTADSGQNIENSDVVKKIGFALLSSVMSVLFFIPWLVYFLKQSHAQDFTLRVNPSLWNIPEIFSYTAYGQAVPPSVNMGIHLFALLGIIPLVIIVMGFFTKGGGEELEGSEGVKYFYTGLGNKLAGIYLFTPLIITMAVSFLTRFHIFEFKYFFVICPALWMLAAYFICSVKPVGVKIFITCLFLLSNFLTVANSQFNSYYYPQDWKRAAMVVKEKKKPGDLVVVHPSMMASPFLFYYNRVDDLVPLDFPQDPRAAALDKCRGIWFVSTPGHPFVSQAGLVNYLFGRFPSEKVMETENYMPSNILRIDYLRVKPEENGIK
ncbi:MAG: glycosyltransferase family 39 protein [Firmicutes bacterium]|nr:glycosyltransferase family 39 protein [Bacillota bacterium]